MRRRGSLTVWFTDEAIAAWRAEPRTTPGGQSHYSTLAITTALTMRAVFGLALRQTEGPRGVIDLFLGQLNREDFAALGIDAEMQLTPGSAAGRAVLFNQLFTGSTELQAGAVHEQMQRAGTRPAERWHFQRLAAAAHC